MDKQEILKIVDHTFLKQQATWEDIKQICDEGIRFSTASVCIPPSFVRKAKEYVKNKIKICTVIGFPNGYNTTAVKIYEAEDAIKSGADEIDMVINIGMLKEHLYDEILLEINQIKRVCNDRVLKGIIETCLLTEEEKIKMCEIVSISDADFIKTSTGFSTSGATVEDIKLLKNHMKSTKGLKAAGGITASEDAERFIQNGATRLGTSKLVKIMLG